MLVARDRMAGPGSGEPGPPECVVISAASASSRLEAMRRRLAPVDRVGVDERAAVQFGGAPSGNLFAAGEVMAGNVLGQGYTAGVGMTIGTVFGRIAGASAARAALGDRLKPRPQVAAPQELHDAA